MSNRKSDISGLPNLQVGENIQREIKNKWYQGQYDITYFNEQSYIFHLLLYPFNLLSFIC